jgi:hypothetical protein
MATAEFLERKVDGVLRRADALLEQRLRRDEEEQRRADAALEAARRQKARSYAEGCREYAARYDDSFASFSVQTPQPVDGEHPEKYRIRLFNRLARKLPEGHEWGSTRADDLPLGPAMDRIEEFVLAAAKAEGERPSAENLPEDGIIMRTRTDANTGSRFNEFYGRESYIKQMGRPGRRVERIVDRRTGNVIFGKPFPH